MARRPSELTAVDQGRSWQGQDHVALRYYQRVREVECEDESSLLLPSGY